VATEREFAEYAPPRLHAGVTASAPSVVAAILHAGVTVMEPGTPDANMHAGVTERAAVELAETRQAGVMVMEPTVYELNVHEGVTVSVPTVAAEKVQMFVQADCRPIRKVVAEGVPHTNAPDDSSCAAVLIDPQLLIVSDAVPATKVSGAPTVRVPTAAVKTPVAVFIAVTATGAAWVVTWKLPGAGFIT